MAPSTRSTKRALTPDHETEPCEASTRKRTRFFDAYDERHMHESLRAIARDKHVPKSTASKWLHEREQLGSPAYRRARRRMKKPGPKPKITSEQCKLLVSPSRNPVRDQLYEA